MDKTEEKIGWPRDQYSGPGGGRYTGPGGGLYTGPGGGKYTGPGGGLYTGPGGGLYTGPGGGLYTGPGGGLYTGPGGGLYTGPNGGLYTGPDGGLYTGPGGGMYTGPCNDHYYSIIPPWDIFIQELLKRGLKNYVDIIFKYYKYGIEKQTYSAFNDTGRRDSMDVYVANAPGKDYDSEHPSGYDSWIDYWNKKRYPGTNKKASWCRNCGTKAKDLDDEEIEGGHVEYCEKHNDGKWYYNKVKGIFITPLCSKCNNPDNTATFSVETSDLIKIP